MPGVCRNCRHVVSVCRCGAGGIFRALRTRRIVDALTRWPSLSSSPWIRWYPQALFSAASRSISAAISALIGGRPVRFGQAHFWVTRAAVPPQDGTGGNQPVHPQPCRQETDQRCEDSTVGPVQLGPRMDAAQPATSCRSTSSSASLEADDRPSRTSQLQSRTKTR
jgi:hypothetical protein